VQAFFDRVTVDTGPTRWLTSEFGAAVALAVVATAWFFWRARDAVASQVRSADAVLPTPTRVRPVAATP